MDNRTHRFFIALLPPAEVQDAARRIQQIFVERYQSKAALRSPPHITLQPPFEWAMEDLPRLSQGLEAFARSQPPVPMALSGFGAFPPRVIYLNVVRTPELLQLHAALLHCMEQSFGIVDAVAKTRPFAPHLTVGFRDLTKSNFRAAWEEFQPQAIEFAFTVSHLTLLLHDGQQWNAHQDFPLLNLGSP